MADQTATKTRTDRKADVSRKAKEALDTAADMSDEAYGKIRDKTMKAQEQVREAAKQAQKHSQDMLGRVADYVQDNPLTAMGIAFAAGTILSALTRHRH